MPVTKTSYDKPYSSDHLNELYGDLRQLAIDRKNNKTRKMHVDIMGL